MQFIGIESGLFLTLLAGLGAAIALMYLIKLRRRRVQVPYGAIWQAILSEASTRSLWQRLKRWLSLIVQLLVLVLLLFALRDPRPADEAVEGRHVVIMVDTSASMAAVAMPGGRDRMEAARERALTEFDGLDADDRVMLVRVDGNVRPLTPFVRPSSSVRRMLVDLDYSATTADWDAALVLAERSLLGKSRPESVMITDGAWSETVDGAVTARLEAGTGRPQARLVPVGTASGNLAVTAFNVRRYLANRLNYEVFVELSSTFDVALTAELVLTANGRAVERMLVELEPNGRATRIIRDLPTGGNRLTARVSVVAGDANDVLSLDDSAYALLPEERRRRVLLVTDDNLFVEAPLLLDQNLELRRVSPDTYSDLAPDEIAAFDVTVFNEVAPPLLADQDALFIHPEGEASPWQARGRVDDPIIDRFERSDPLMRWIHGFRSLNIASALRLELGDDDEGAAFAISGDPMFVRREAAGQRTAAVAFRLHESDFALRVIYPLFMLNAVDWLSSDAGELVPAYTTDRAWSVRVPGGGALESLAISAPDGSSAELQVIDGVLTFAPERPGFYVAEAAPEGPLVLAANLFDDEESRIAPIEAEAGPDGAERPSASAELDTGGLFAGKHIWFFLVLAALGLLAVEWFTYHRRLTV